MSDVGWDEAPCAIDQKKVARPFLLLALDPRLPVLAPHAVSGPISKDYCKR